MMDATPLCKKGFHPMRPELDSKGMFESKFVPRRRTNKVDYYFIDYDLSRHFEEGTEREVVGDDGPRNRPPEVFNIHGYDPYPADVFYLGSVFYDEFLAVGSSCFTKKK